MKVWADFLFPVLDEAPEEVQLPISDENIARVMAASGHGDVILDENDNIYEKGDRFKSFYHQVSQPMSRKALLVGFLSVQLKNVWFHLLCMMEYYYGCFSLPFSLPMASP